jgi:hypothetical protein
VQAHHREAAIGVGCGQSIHRGDALVVHVREEELGDPGLQCPREHVLTVRVELLVVEVGVGVDEHSGRSKNMCPCEHVRMWS